MTVLNVTADGDCSHEIKWCLLLGKKAMTNLDRILKSRDITLPTKVCLVKAMVFPVVMYGCESWIIKKAEHQRIDAFELWCWRRLLRVPWAASRSNQSLLKISPGCSLVGLMLKLKLQYFGHLMRRTDCLEKTLMLGKIEGRRRQGWQRMKWLDGILTWWIRVWASSGSWWWTGKPGVLQSMGSQRVVHNWATELNWTGIPVVKKSACQCKWHRFDPWSGKIPHAMEQLSTCTTTPDTCGPRTCALQQEKPLQREAQALQLQKTACSNEDPMEPK